MVVFVFILNLLLTIEKSAIGKNYETTFWNKNLYPLTILLWTFNWQKFLEKNENPYFLGTPCIYFLLLEDATNVFDIREHTTIKYVEGTAVNFGLALGALKTKGLTNTLN